MDMDQLYRATQVEKVLLNEDNVGEDIVVYA